MIDPCTCLWSWGIWYGVCKLFNKLGVCINPMLWEMEQKSRLLLTTSMVNKRNKNLSAYTCGINFE